MAAIPFAFPSTRYQLFLLAGRPNVYEAVPIVVRSHFPVNLGFLACV